MCATPISPKVARVKLAIPAIEKPSTRVSYPMNKYFVFVPQHIEREVEKDIQVLSELEAERQALVRQAQQAGELSA